MHTEDAAEPSDDIAIVGLACRFPGAPNATAFWDNLAQGVESVTFFSEDELRAAGVPDALIEHPHYLRSGGGRLSDVDRFDAAFFGFDDHEAALLDPQHRFFLECAHEALEDAGYTPDRYDGAIGVFGGAGGPHYLLHNIAANRAAMRAAGGLATSITNEKDFTPLRVSYLLDLRGPSIGVQTACSTSLVATHLACQSLLGGECDMALAGGASISAWRTEGFLRDPDSIYAEDGHCRAFDASASGMVGGDGVGIVVLKRLDDALADGDTVRAVIKGSAINNDGAGKVGFLAPGVASQKQVIREALNLADIDPRTIDYVEAHGTGTPLGDMIEVSALTDAYREDTDDVGFCGIGSVKTNIGHCNTAAGAAGLIKTVLALQHATLPPSLHFERPNPEIDFATSPFRVITKREEWRSGPEPRRAAVHAMAIGGTNAHVLLEEAPPAEPGNAVHRDQILTLSARTDTALATCARQLADHLRSASDADLPHIAYTLQVGRRTHSHRRVVVAADTAAAIQALGGGAGAIVQERTDREVVLWLPDTPPPLGTACESTLAEPAFRDAVALCAAAAGIGADDLARHLSADAPPADRDTGRVVALTTHFALARLWQHLGVTPSAVLGDGVGTIAAACIVDAISLETGMDLARASDDDARETVLRSARIQEPTLPCLHPTTATWLGQDAWSRPATWQPALAASGASSTAWTELLAKPRVVLATGPGAPDSAVTLDGRATAGTATTLATLWLAGADIDWARWHEGESLRRVPLPTYPFERLRHWIEPDPEAAHDIAVPEIPTTASGTRPELSTAFVAPETELERQIAEQWCLTLQIDRVGIHDNFFEVGGRSLTGIRVMTRLREALSVDLALRQLFEAPTVAELAKLVEIRRWVGGTDDDDEDREEIEL